MLFNCVSVNTKSKKPNQLYEKSKFIKEMNSNILVPDFTLQGKLSANVSMLAPRLQAPGRKQAVSY